MMHSIYLYCAIFGAAIVVVNFVTLLLGIGGDQDGGGDGDVGDAGDVDGGADAGDSADSDAGDADGDSHAASHHMEHGAVFLRMFTLRAVTSGIAFFGLAGLACEDSALSDVAILGISIACGFLGMYLVYRLSRALSAFNHDGSLTLASAVGATGTVYLRIPAARSGIGKVTVLQQERLVEYEAVTDDDVELSAGTPITIVEILSSNQVRVTRGK